MTGLFMAALPIASLIGALLSGFLLDFDGHLGLHGWQWMFIIEAFPAVLLGFATLFYLTDRPDQAIWLSQKERSWLSLRLASEETEVEKHGAITFARAFFSPTVLALWPSE